MKTRWVQRWVVPGSTGKPYVVAKNSDNQYACSCPAWIFKSPRVNCKHIKELLVTLAVAPVIQTIKPVVSHKKIRPITDSEFLNPEFDAVRRRFAFLESV